MTHLWVRAEPRAHEQRVGLTPEGAAILITQGFKVTVEDSGSRALPTTDYAEAGATIAPEGAWPGAPADAIIFGLKELASDGSPLRHSHIMFGHAFKGQPDGKILLDRFRAGGGTLYDLEYLVNEDGRRVAAFGYWAGFAGAAVSLKALAAQHRNESCPSVGTYASQHALTADVAHELDGATPSVMIIGALGRVGTGAAALCDTLGLPLTLWDRDETAHGGPFPEILAHEIFLNCILAMPGVPVFVPQNAKTATRRLRVIGDIACDPTSDFSPVKVYDRTTGWTAPALRVHDIPPLDVMAIDNLPAMLPVESSRDFAAQLLPFLKTLDTLDKGVWARARAIFDEEIRT